MSEDPKSHSLSVMMNILCGYCDHLFDMSKDELKSLEDTGIVNIDEIRRTLKALSIIVDSLERIKNI